jgi:1,4-alpha-glucan branching enzyme
LVGDFNKWQCNKEYSFTKIENGVWELKIKKNAVNHKDKYKLLVEWENSKGLRIPAYSKRAVQDEQSKSFDAQIWLPEKEYEWKNSIPPRPEVPLIYETHIGMSSKEEKVASFTEFKENVLPRIKKLGYNTIQIMAIQEHPYYGSFGYHVSNFFAVSSRFGTPEELKDLIDTAHGMGIFVIMDLVHSHAVKNEMEGLANMDGSENLYFHSGFRRLHVAWDSLCFDYGKNEVLHFLLSNCKFWLEEYRFDGFRYDGVTSMLYFDHGLEKDFTNYNQYFDGNQDEDAIIYISMANRLIHEFKPEAITVAEDMSGMPGLAASTLMGGMGFNYRMAMGVPDYWIKLLKDFTDDDWNVGDIFYQLTSKRPEEKTVSYAESHDQALVGDKTIIFRLIDKEMYFSMDKNSQNIIVDRGLALHKMIRLATSSASGGAYLNFMGNEFGHPEWIDFPREGNGWSYKHARRLWNIVDDKSLKYQFLNDFEKKMIGFYNKTKILKTPEIYKIHENVPDKVLAYTRGEYLFVFNFNPTQSFPNYELFTEKAKYKILFTTDDDEFGGFGRIDKSVKCYTTKDIEKVDSPNILKLYLPARTAIILKKDKAKSLF